MVHGIASSLLLDKKIGGTYILDRPCATTGILVRRTAQLPATKWNTRRIFRAGIDVIGTIEI